MDNFTELLSELLRADDQIKDLCSALVWIQNQPNCPPQIKRAARAAVIKRYQPNG